MTLGSARAALSIIWLVGSAPLLAAIAFMSLMDRFGASWDVPWNWISPLIFPTLGLIISTWTTGENLSANASVKARHVFWGSVFLSIAYILLMYLIIFGQPFSDQTLEKAMRSSGIYLGMFQAVVAGAVAKFFIENA